jgi:hypothetical protein
MDPVRPNVATLAPSGPFLELAADIGEPAAPCTDIEFALTLFFRGIEVEAELRVIELAEIAILLRESYREAGKTKNRTLANLSRWPAERIE